jgi:hypothetical protein
MVPTGARAHGHADRSYTGGVEASTDGTILYETRVRPRYAIIAAGAAVLFLAAGAAQLAGPTAKVSELTVQLITIHKRFPLDIIGAVLQGSALVMLAWTLSFLFGAAKARKPEMAPAVLIVAFCGAGVSAIGGVIYATILATKAHTFVTTGDQTYQEAHHLTGGAVLPVLQTLDIVAQFALELGLILITLNAMRVGLLTKFLGYCGIVVGVAGMLLIGSPPAAAIQIFWLAALAYLLAGRWPGGDPPSWRTGKAEPWPTAAQLREQRMAGAGGGAGGGRIKPAPAPAPETVGAPTPARTRSDTPKRKRKRRR